MGRPFRFKTIDRQRGIPLSAAQPLTRLSPAADGTSTSHWAIAIHGGAGSDPAKWDETVQQTRLAGLAQALRAGESVLREGGEALDAIEAAVGVLEDHGDFNAGRGAVLTTAGQVELDASIMDGRDRRCGAVAGVTRIRNPIRLARRVMMQTPHVLLVGPGADEFARQQSSRPEQPLELAPPDYFLGYRERHSNIDVAPTSRSSSTASDDDSKSHLGTVGCVAVDTGGNLAAGTSTGGTLKKLPGRVGDSPIIGAGTFACNNTCAVSATGMGEEFIRHAVAYDIAAQMQYAGRSLDEAVTVVIRQRLQAGSGGLIAMDASGNVSLQHNTPGMSCGLATSSGRFEKWLLLPGGAMVMATGNGG